MDHDTECRPQQESDTKWTVDEWLDNGLLECARSPELAYVHFMLSFFRQSAAIQAIHGPFMAGYGLYVDYGGKVWKVVGASHLGDIWLKDPISSGGAFYDRRVMLDFTQLTGWRNTLYPPHPSTP